MIYEVRLQESRILTHLAWTVLAYDNQGNVLHKRTWPGSQFHLAEREAMELSIGAGK